MMDKIDRLTQKVTEIRELNGGYVPVFHINNQYFDLSNCVYDEKEEAEFINIMFCMALSAFAKEIIRLEEE